MSAFKNLGLVLMGAAVGVYMPILPAPLNAIQPYVGFVLLVVAIILFVKSD